MQRDKIYCGDSLEILKGLPDGCVRCCVTSPPYFAVRDYGVEGQIGLEGTVDAYLERLVAVFREVRRVLTKDGSLWANIADTYSSGAMTGAKGPNSSTGHNKAQHEIAVPIVRKPPPGFKRKELLMVPARLAMALSADGWYLRQDLIWHKPNVFPESVKDRCTRSHEYIFLLTKSERYFYNSDAIKEDAVRGHAGSDFRKGKTAIHQMNRMSLYERVDDGKRNKRSVWSINTQPLKTAHFATFPEKLVEPCILAGSQSGDLILDPFMGAGTVALVAKKLGRDYIGVELNPGYIEIANQRLANFLPATYSK